MSIEKSLQVISRAYWRYWADPSSHSYYIQLEQLNFQDGLPDRFDHTMFKRIKSYRKIYFLKIYILQA